MKKNKFTWILGLLFTVMLVAIASCSDEFNEEEFIEKQANLAETKAQQDHERALEIIQAQLAATLDAIAAQAAADQDTDAARIAAQQAANEALANLQALLAQELARLNQSLQNEEDSTAAANYLAAYRAAGLFTQFTAVVSTDGAPIEGVSVSLSTQANPVLTAANGSAVFTDVIVGNNVLNVSSGQILDYRATLTFSRLQIMTVGTASVVEPATATLNLNLFAEVASSADLGIVSGVVTIETDLTNDTPEFPEGAVVSADLSQFLNTIGVAIPNGVTVSAQALTEGDMGVGEISATDGSYSLSVPVGENGSNVSLIFPEITANQTLAISERDDSEIPAEIATVPARFNLNNGVTAVPQVRNYVVAVNEPAAEGSGFELAFAVRAARLPILNSNSEDLFNQGQNSFYVNDNNNFSSFNRANTKIESAGSGYQFSPVIRDAAQDTVGFGYLTGTFASVAIVDGGTGLGADANYNVTADFYSGANIFNVINIGTATTNAAGVITTVELNENAFAVNPNNPYRQFDQMNGFRLDSVVVRDITGGTTDASLSPTMNFALTGIRVNDTDQDVYSVKNPSLTFIGGGASTQASLKVTMSYQYDVTIANAGTGYEVLPNDIQMVGRFASNNDDFFEGSSSGVNLVILGQQNNDQLINRLKLDGNGGLEWTNPSLELFTSSVFSDAPTTQVNELNRTTMDAQFFVGGQDNDQLFLNVGQFNNNTGDPYAEPREITVTERIAGLGGTGYSIDLNENFDSRTGIYNYAFNFTESNGSGYSDNLNAGAANPNSNSSVTVPVRRGETTVRNIYYGTGVRLENVGGDN
jgi:hypothetical protein